MRHFLILALAATTAACGNEPPNTPSPGSNFDCDDTDAGTECGNRHVDSISQGLTSPSWPGCYMNDLDASDGYVNEWWDRSELGIGYASVMVAASAAGEYDIEQLATRTFYSHSITHTPSSSYPSFFSNNVIINTSPCFTYGGVSVKWVKFDEWACTSGASCAGPVANGSTPPAFYNSTKRRTSVMGACGSSVTRLANTPVVTQAQGGNVYNAIPETYGGAMCQCSMGAADCPAQF